MRPGDPSVTMTEPKAADTDASALEALHAAHRALAARYPGERTGRQPVHTVYGGAQLYKAETPRRLGELALKSLDTYAPSAEVFARGCRAERRESWPLRRRFLRARVRAREAKARA